MGFLSGFSGSRGEAGISSRLASPDWLIPVAITAGSLVHSTTKKCTVLDRPPAGQPSLSLSPHCSLYILFHHIHSFIYLFLTPFTFAYPFLFILVLSPSRTHPFLLFPPIFSSSLPTSLPLFPPSLRSFFPLLPLYHPSSLLPLSQPPTTTYASGMNWRCTASTVIPRGFKLSSCVLSDINEENIPKTGAKAGVQRI